MAATAGPAPAHAGVKWAQEDLGEKQGWGAQREAGGCWDVLKGGISLSLAATLLDFYVLALEGSCKLAVLACFSAPL